MQGVVQVDKNATPVQQMAFKWFFIFVFISHLKSLKMLNFWSFYETISGENFPILELRNEAETK